MAESVETTKASPRSSRVMWLRRLAMVAAAYLVCWAITWIFAPAALDRWWDMHHRARGGDPPGPADRVEFRTGVRFKGEGFEYMPDFSPKGKWWCCVGRPWCPAPFVVASEVAWLYGALDGFAGDVWFIWTPFGMVPVYGHKVWSA